MSSPQRQAFPTVNFRQRLNGKGAKPQAKHPRLEDPEVGPIHKEVPQKRKEVPGFQEQDRYKRTKAADSPVSRNLVAASDGSAAGGVLNAAPHVLYSKVRAKSKQLRSPRKLRSGKFRSGTKKPRKEEAVPANQSEKAIFPWFTKILNLAFGRATTVVNEPTTEGHDSTSSILTDDQTSPHLNSSAPPPLTIPQLPPRNLVVDDVDAEEPPLVELQHEVPLPHPLVSAASMTPTEIDSDEYISPFAAPPFNPPPTLAQIQMTQHYATRTSPAPSLVPTEIDSDQHISPFAAPPFNPPPTLAQIQMAQHYATRTSPTPSMVPTEIDLDHSSVYAHSASTELSQEAEIDEDPTPTASVILNAQPPLTVSAIESHQAPAATPGTFSFRFGVPRWALNVERAGVHFDGSPPRDNILGALPFTGELLETDSSMNQATRPSQKRRKLLAEDLLEMDPAPNSASTPSQKRRKLNPVREPEPATRNLQGTSPLQPMKTRSGKIYSVPAKRGTANEVRGQRKTATRGLQAPLPTHHNAPKLPTPPMPAHHDAPQLSTPPDNVRVEDGIGIKTYKKATTANKPHPLKKANQSFVLITSKPRPNAIPASRSSLLWGGDIGTSTIGMAARADSESEVSPGADHQPSHHSDSDSDVSIAKNGGTGGVELQNTDDREGRRDKGKGKQVVRYSDDEESSDDDSFTTTERGRKTTRRDQERSGNRPNKQSRHRDVRDSEEGRYGDCEESSDDDSLVMTEPSRKKNRRDPERSGNHPNKQTRHRNVRDSEELVYSDEEPSDDDSFMMTERGRKKTRREQERFGNRPNKHRHRNVRDSGEGDSGGEDQGQIAVGATKHRPKRLVMLQGQVRDMVKELIATDENGIFLVPSDRQLTLFKSSANNLQNGPQLNPLLLDLAGPSTRTAWNKKMADIFATHFVEQEGALSSDVGLVHKTFTTHLLTLSKKYKTQIVGSDVDDEIALAVQDENTRKAKDHRQRLLHERRVEISERLVKAYPRSRPLRRFNRVWKHATKDICSEDEAYIVNDRIHYRKIRPAWRSTAPDVDDWFRIFDYLHLSTRFQRNGKRKQGRIPGHRHPAILGMRASNPKVYPIGLPKNFYEETWLGGLSESDKKGLGERTALELIFHDDIIRLAEKFRNIKGETRLVRRRK